VDAIVFRLLYVCGILFNILCSPYWHAMVYAMNNVPKGYSILEYDKAKTMGIDKERAKIVNALGQFEMIGLNMGYLFHTDPM
jgi:hypothetical protein